MKAWYAKVKDEHGATVVFAETRGILRLIKTKDTQTKPFCSIVSKG